MMLTLVGGVWFYLSRPIPSFGALGYGRLCAMYVCIMDMIDNHYSTSELPAARVHNNTAWRYSFVLFG